MKEHFFVISCNTPPGHESFQILFSDLETDVQNNQNRRNFQGHVVDKLNFDNRITCDLQVVEQCLSFFAPFV